MTDLAKLRELLDSNKSNETHRCYWCREITSGLCDCNAVEDITTLLDEVEKLRAALREIANRGGTSAAVARKALGETK